MLLANKARTLALVLQSKPESGGANHYETALFNILRKLCLSKGIRMEVFVPDSFEKQKDMNVICFRNMDLMRLVFQQVFPFRSSRSLTKKFATSFSKQISDLTIDVVYFSSPNKLAVDRTLPSVVSTVWDIGHRDLPLLPEMSSKGRWLLRELYLRSSLKNSKFVVTDSTATKARLQKTFGVLAAKIFPIGLLPMNHKIPNSPRLIDDVYFIYPAQKWRHKNHTTILKAFKKVVEIHPSVKLVLTGSDKGEGKKISREIAELGIGNKVLDLGFVSDEEIVNLQFYAVALLMPSRLGPTNIPPLDALNLGTHAIVSDAHEFDEEIQNLLTVVPARNSEIWAKAMLDVLTKKNPQPVQHTNVAAEDALGEMLESFFVGPIDSR